MSKCCVVLMRQLFEQQSMMQNPMSEAQAKKEEELDKAAEIANNQAKRKRKWGYHQEQNGQDNKPENHDTSERK